MMVLACAARIVAKRLGAALQRVRSGAKPGHSAARRCQHAVLPPALKDVDVRPIPPYQGPLLQHAIVEPHATTHLEIVAVHRHVVAEDHGRGQHVLSIVGCQQGLPLPESRHKVGPNLDICGSHIDLAAAEVELIGTVGREMILRDQLDADPEAYDYVLMDCPPSLGILTLNALCAAREVLIPLQAHFLALHGLSKLLETTCLPSRTALKAARRATSVFP